MNNNFSTKSSHAPSISKNIRLLLYIVKELNLSCILDKVNSGLKSILGCCEYPFTMSWALYLGFCHLCCILSCIAISDQ